jgi:NADPH-dependent ferric siderophore reductase
MGSAAVWAAGARPGDVTEVACTPKPFNPETGPTAYILTGDSSALPAINSLLQYLPDTARAIVVIDDGHADRERLPIARNHETRIVWLEPQADRSGVANMIRDLGPDPSDAYVWVAGERSLVRQSRSVMRDQLGFDSDRYHAQTYWIEGRQAG